MEQTRLISTGQNRGNSQRELRSHAPPAVPAARGLHDRVADDLAARIAAAKEALGDRLFILGHHYQRDEVMRWADARGDSFRLSVLAQQRPEADYIVFCGVHFMAESADMLTTPDQQVILPDLNAGCSMADMADIDSVEEAWEALEGIVDIERVVPITYMNSSAALKAFVGRNGGAVCTSTNARAVLEWAFRPQAEGGAGGQKVLFFPDQHLGRNTGLAMGYTLDDMRVWDPRKDMGGLERGRPQGRHVPAVEGALLGAPALPARARGGLPARSTPTASSSSTRSAATRCASSPTRSARPTSSSAPSQAAPAGAVIGVGTEIHLVKRLDDETPDKTIVSLDPLICPCSTMFRIDAPHLCWVLENLVEGRVVNRIVVDDDTAEWAKVALDRMLTIT